MKWLVCVLLVIVEAEPKPDFDMASAVARYVEAAKPLLPNAIKRAEVDVDHFKRSLVAAKKDGAPERKRGASENLERAENELKGLRNGSLCPRVLIDERDMKLGSIGTFYIQPFVFQVINKSTVLARTVISSQSPGGAPSDGPLLWVEGLPEADRADGTNFEGILYVDITGSRQYDNALGVTNTVWVARAIDPKVFEEQVNKAWQEMNPPKSRTRRRQTTRN